MAVNLATAYVQIQPSMNGFKPAVAREMAGVESMAAASGKRSGSLMSNAMGTALKVGGAAVAAGAGALIAKSLMGGFKRLNSIDQAEAKLRGLGRSAGEIKGIMGSVKSAVDGTKYSLDEAADAAAVFSTVGVKSGADMERTMKLLTDTVSQSGSGFNDIQSIFTKIRSTGALTTETFDMLNERGTGAGEAISKYLGVPMEQVRTAAKGMAWDDFASAMEKNIGGAAKKSGDTFQGSFDNMMTSFNKLGAVVLGPLFKKLPPLFDRIKQAIGDLSPKVEKFSEGLANSGEWVKRNEGWIKPLVAVLGGMALGLVAVGIATKAWAAYQAILNIAMTANPIGIIVVAIAGLVAGLIYAYKNSETFRNIINSVWNGIKTVIGAVWGWIKDTLWPGIQMVFKSIGTVVMWLWNNVITPAWNGIKAAIGIAWGIIQGYFNVMMSVFRGIGTVVMWLWNNVITPAWDGIKWAIGKAWDSIKFYMDIGGKAFEKVGEIAGKVKDVIVGAWNNVVDFIKSIPGKLGDIAGTIFNPIMNGAKRVFNSIARFWNSTVGKLTFKAPDWVPGLGGKEFRIRNIPELATGGRIRGPGGPREDKILAKLSNGEYVINAAAVNQYGLGFMDQVNSGSLPAFATGGYVSPAGLTGGRIMTGNPPNIGLTTDVQRWMWDQIRAVFPSATMMSGTRTAEVGSGRDNHMGARAIDISDTSSTMHKIAAFIADKFPNSLELIFGPGFSRQIKNSKSVGDGGGAFGFYAGAGDHSDHVHWATGQIVSAVGGDSGNGVVSDQADRMAANNSTDSDTHQWDYSDGSAEDKKQKYEKDNLEAKQKFDTDVAALKAKHGIGGGNELAGRSRDLAKRRRDLSAWYRAERAKAAGNKDRLAALKDEYDSKSNALRSESDRLADARDSATSQRQADKAGYDAAYQALKKQYEDDKLARKQAYDSAKGSSSGGDKSYPTTATGWAKFAASELVGGQMSSLLGVLGINDSPGILTAASEVEKNVRITDKQGRPLWGSYQKDSSSNQPSTPDPTTNINTPDATKPGGVPNIAYSPGGGAEQWRPLMEWAIGYVQRGLTASAAQVDAGVKQIQSESGGDPNIAQRISDVNGTGEMAGVGLLQIIPGTFKSSRDPSLPDDRRNPPANVVAALRYYTGRYGSDLTKMWGKGHGYAGGGWVSGPGSGRSDSIPARLSNGEFVVNASAARRNPGMLEAINDGVRPTSGAGGPVYNIATARTEDAFIEAQRSEKRRMAAGMAHL